MENKLLLKIFFLVNPWNYIPKFTRSSIPLNALLSLSVGNLSEGGLLQSYTHNQILIRLVHTR